MATTTATTSTTRSPVSIYSVQHWIKFPGETVYTQVTEDTKADASRDTNTYEPTYLDRKVQPKYVLGRTDTLEFEIDAMAPGGIQQKLAKYEDETDVAVDYARTIAYDFEAGKEVAGNALVAKHASATLNMNPFSGDDIAPITMSATLTITTDYDKGTFDSSTGTYTPATA
jgi:hypothetical protein